jgi:hypothetical protein
MDTAKAYLTAVAADADSAARVEFDQVDSVVDSTSLTGAADTETSDQLNQAVLTLTAKNVTTAAISAAKHKHAMAITSTMGASGASVTINIKVDGTNELFDSAITPVANETLFISAIKSATNLTRAAAYGVTLDANPGAFPTGKILIANVASLTDESYSLGADNSVVAFNITATDLVNLTIDGKLLSGTFAALAALGTNITTAYATSNPGVATIADFRDMVAGAWMVTYGTGGSSGTESLFNIDTGTTATLSISAKSKSGRRGYDKGYSLSVTSASTTLSSSVYGLTYGATTDASDNNTISNGIVVTVEAVTGGTILDETAGLLMQTIGTTLTASDVSVLPNVYELLTTTAQLNVNPTVDTTTATNIYPGDARGDAVRAEGLVAEVADAAVSFNRLGWL